MSDANGDQFNHREVLKKTVAAASAVAMASPSLSANKADAISVALPGDATSSFLVVSRYI
jgi:hypothetical protein